MGATKSDFDSPWKYVLERYLQPFLHLCFPPVHAAIDWSQPQEFLDKELQQIVRDADLGKRFADKLVKVWLHTGQSLWILIHVEVQGQREKGFAERMYVYHYRIGDRYHRPVVSLAVLCDPHPQWRPAIFHSQLLGCRLEFEFPIVKLLDFRAQWTNLETNPNPCATVIMAYLKTQETRRLPEQRKVWKLALTRRLYEQGLAKQDILELFNFIDWVMRLPEALEQAFRAELKAYEETRQVKYVTSIERLAKKEGRQEEALHLLQRAIRLRLGSVPAELQEQLQELSVEQLEELMDSMLTKSLEDLKQELAAIASPSSSSTTEEQPNSSDV